MVKFPCSKWLSNFLDSNPNNSLYSSQILFGDDFLYRPQELYPRDFTALKAVWLITEHLYKSIISCWQPRWVSWKHCNCLGFLFRYLWIKFIKWDVWHFGYLQISICSPLTSHYHSSYLNSLSIFSSFSLQKYYSLFFLLFRLVYLKYSPVLRWHRGGSR